jgi:hypothetical protein
MIGETSAGVAGVLVIGERSPRVRDVAFVGMRERLEQRDLEIGANLRVLARRKRDRERALRIALRERDLDIDPHGLDVTMRRGGDRVRAFLRGVEVAGGERRARVHDRAGVGIEQADPLRDRVRLGEPAESDVEPRDDRERLDVAAIVVEQREQIDRGGAVVGLT